jgi:hypothetical protein
MDLNLPLEKREQAERLRTAVYRFAELKTWSAPPVEVHSRAGRLSGLVVFGTPEAAEEFRRFWETFGADRPQWSGFRDL